MNKSEYLLIKVTSENLTVGNNTLGIQKRRGQVMLKISDIQHVFKSEGEGLAEIVMTSGDRFTAKIDDLSELLHAIDRIKK